MNCCGTTSCNGNTSIICTDEHFIFCIHVVWIIVCFPDICKDQFGTFQSVAVTERSSFFGCKALYYMSQCIYTGSCNDCFWQFCDHLCIQDYIVRDHIVINNTFFGFFFRDCYDCIAGGFRSGSTGGWNHDSFYLFFSLCWIVQKVFNCVGCTFQNAGKFCRIHNGSSAKSNDQVTFLTLYHIDNSFNL